VKRDAAEIAELSRLIDAALELPPEERSTWIEQLPASQDTLKPALRRLLAMQPAGNHSYTLSDVSAQVHAAMQGAVSATEALEFKDGARVGPYELMRELGRGGMGTVWLARRTEGLTKRTVALKLPHPGMLHAEFAARMGRERDILESLAHPNIARLYDAGVTAGGQPWLALEYIEGVPINVYCDEKRLGVRERIRLFIQVLQAIQYAHSHLVIHRDLKPANILVTASGNAVVLDFGIAKLTVEGATADTALTQFGGRALTPDYASPEQIAGAPLTTASDVYSLGVILYELLTGERPYKLARGSAAALEEAILAADVRRPSQAVGDDPKAEARSTSPNKLARALRGDLDTIVLTALRVKLAERYRTVDALAVDIQKYLDGGAINARPESWWDASKRFVRRHKLIVGSTAVVVLALSGGIAAAVWQADKARASEQRAMASEQRAITEATTSDAVKNFMIGIFRTNTLYQEEAANARKMNSLQLLEANANRLETQFKDNPVLYRELLTVITKLLGESQSADYEKHVQELIALLEKFPNTEVERVDLYSELTVLHQDTDPKGSLEFVDKGFAILGSSNDPPHRKARAAMHFATARAKMRMGDVEAALPPLREATKLLEDGFTNTTEYGHALGDLGWIEMRKENTAVAVDLFERAMKAYLADPTAYQRTIAQGRCDLSIGYTIRKQYADAERELLTAASLYRKDYGDESPQTAMSMARAAKAMTQQNRFDEALAVLRPAVTVLLAPTSDAVPDYKSGAAEYLADAIVQSGRINNADADINQAVEVSKLALPQAQFNPLFSAAELDLVRGHFADAETKARAAVAIVEKVFGPDSKRMLRANNRLGRMLLIEGKLGRADALFLSTMKAEAANSAVFDSPFTMASIQHANVLIARGKPRDAVPILTAALQKHLAQPENQRDLNDETEIQLSLGRALMTSGNAKDASPHLERALALRQTQFAQSPRLAEVQIVLADCKLQLGDAAGARALLVKAKAIHAANTELGPQYRKPLAELTVRLASN
jgi:serine/threonine protein kinase/tetratricopeptide (TPR) repeat protein